MAKRCHNVQTIISIFGRILSIHNKNRTRNFNLFTIMIICDEHKFVFIHVPRTGGTSVRQMWKKWDGGHRTHTTYQEVKQRFRRGRDLSKYFTFGFIRNPWERVYSLFWKHVKNSPVDTSRGFKYWMFDESRTDSKRHKQPALHFLKGVDYIARYENFGKEWDYIFEHVGLPRIQLPHAYKYRDNTPYQEIYDDEMKKFVSKYHQIDIDYGAYTF